MRHHFFIFWHSRNANYIKSKAWRNNDNRLYDACLDPWMDLGHKKGWNPQWNTNYSNEENRLANLVAYMLRHPNQGTFQNELHHSFCNPRFTV
jgi:hypothetical protein